MYIIGRKNAKKKNSKNKYIFTQDDSSKEMKDTMLDRIHKTILYEKSKMDVFSKCLAKMTVIMKGVSESVTCRVLIQFR